MRLRGFAYVNEEAGVESWHGVDMTTAYLLSPSVEERSLVSCRKKTKAS
jgi:hypothetical protein